MRVLYLINALSVGGAELSLAALAPHYGPLGIDLEVAYHVERPGVHDELRRIGIPVHSLSGPGGAAGWTRRAAQLVRARRPDLVHTTLFEADIVGRIAGSVGRVPVVTSLVNVAYGPEQLADPRLKAWKVRAAQILDAVSARVVVRFHAITSHVADTMARRLRIRRDRIDVVPRGRDPVVLGARTPERRERTRALLGVDGDAPIVLTASRQEFQKGLDVVIEAFPFVLGRHPDARLVLAGREGHESPRLRASVDRLGLESSVAFLGQRDDVSDLLCAADAFVLPSRWEGLGSVLLEAMALEAPIVTSDLPPVREVVDGCALFVPPDDSRELAAAIDDAISDRTGSAERACEARERFLACHSIERIAEAMARFYDRALGGSV